MRSSVYISSEKIEVIGYTKSGKTVKINDYIEYSLPEGTMINGKIIDQANLVECLKSLHTKNPGLFKSPALVVDGSSILSKRILTPKLNKKQYDRLIRDDFADSAESFEELVCDYQALRSESEVASSILACAADRTQVDSYITTFKNAGIKLSTVRVGVQAIINYVSSKPELQKITFVLNIIDGVSMLSMIFENGVNIFMSRTRLYSEDYEQLIQDILYNLSGLVQFNKSEKFHDIEYSYYLGLKDEDIKLMNTINSYPDIQLKVLEIFNGVEGAEVLPADAHMAFFNTLLGGDYIDLVRGCKALDKLKKQQRPKKYWIPVLICTILVIATSVIYIYVKIKGINNDILEVKNYINDETIIAKVNQIDLIEGVTDYYKNIANQLDYKIESENSKSSISNQVLDLITTTNSEKVTIGRFDFNENSGVLNVSGSSSTETDSAEYIDALKASSFIKSIYYTGYSYNNAGEYTFSIEVTLTVEEAAK